MASQTAGIPDKQTRKKIRKAVRKEEKSVKNQVKNSLELIARIITIPLDVVQSVAGRGILLRNRDSSSRLVRKEIHDSESLPASEDPTIYGTELRKLRDSIRSNHHTATCIHCQSTVRIDFHTLENQIREYQHIEHVSKAPVIFGPGSANPKVCKNCEGIICPSCVGSALATKREDAPKTRWLMMKYQPMMMFLPEEVRQQGLEECLSADDISTILCPHCRDDLLFDIDHITD